MTDRTNYQRAAERLHVELEGHGLEETVARMRDDGDSWRTIAEHMSNVLELDITDMTLRRWYWEMVEAERAAAEAAA